MIRKIFLKQAKVVALATVGSRDIVATYLDSDEFRFIEDDTIAVEVGFDVVGDTYIRPTPPVQETPIEPVAETPVAQ